ncbi:MAG: BlaI/MecI/CopY family transcriptional regulator [Clostridiales bacterium]|nr:BlaI/MecI/CopY family transcriptional regulator [Clostridiales bacterium]HBM79286.1 CopY/TcrY family copper transport repressor [Clostridiaceae bacterium]
MNELPQISDAEWQVMKVLWKRPRLTASEIIKELKKSTKWSPKTIHTLINRLVKKGAVRALKGSAFYEYYPLVAEDECVKKETNTFLKKVYGGSLRMLIANFIKDDKLSQDEINELKGILDEKTKNSR